MDLTTKPADDHPSEGLNTPVVADAPSTDPATENGPITFFGTAGRVYEDQSTMDPHHLNEALTGTRPSDIESHYVPSGAEILKLRAPNLVLEREIPIAQNPVSEPIAADLNDGGQVTEGSALHPEGSTDGQHEGELPPPPALPDGGSVEHPKDEA